MKQKYIALALSTIFATALVGCGSDDDSNYIPPGANNPDNGNTGATGGNTGTTGGNTGTTGGDTGTTGGNTGTTGGPAENPIDNPGDAAFEGNRAEKSSVVGQQYVRGNGSDFDKTQFTNGVAGNDGNNTVVGFQKLQNDKMTNIVVAQFPDADNFDSTGAPTTVRYLLGAEPASVSNTNVGNDNSIQNNNDSAIGILGNNGFSTTGNLSPFVIVEQTAGTGGAAATLNVFNQESFVNGVASNVTQTATTADLTDIATDPAAPQSNLENDVRVFGKLSTLSDENDANYFNSARYLTKDAAGNNINLSLVDNGLDATDTELNDFDTEALKLNNVQYGRVTGALDNLTQAQISGQSYVVADFANKDFNSTKSGNTSENTDVYFYRGVGETTLAQMSALNNTGIYQYAGHALMYGIDNTYNGVSSGNGQSNSVAYGSDGEAIGNFVQATYNSGTQTVEGSIYNVWNTNETDGSLFSVDLVTFDGDVVGNSVNGDSQLTYGNVQDSKGSFKGSFFGNKAQELGGALNSVDSSTGYGNSKWGGVFGAQQITTTPTPPVGVPPINAVE